MTEQTNKDVNDFHAIMLLTWSVDPKALAIPWAPKNNSQPLKKSYMMPKSRDGLKTYLESLWMPEDKSPYLVRRHLRVTRQLYSLQRPVEDSCQFPCELAPRQDSG